MTVVIANIKADLGELYDNIEDGTTSVTSLITRAQNFVSDAGGASTDDTVIRPLADAMLVNQMKGSVDSVNKSIGGFSIGSKDLLNMRNYFKSEAKSAAACKGYSLDGLRILFEDSAQ